MVSKSWHNYIYFFGWTIFWKQVILLILHILGCVCADKCLSLSATVVNSWVMLSGKQEFCSPWQQTVCVEARRMAGLGGGPRCRRLWISRNYSISQLFFFFFKSLQAAFYWDSFHCGSGGVMSSISLEEFRSTLAHVSLQWFWGLNTCCVYFPCSVWPI